MFIDVQSHCESDLKNILNCIIFASVKHCVSSAILSELSRNDVSFHTRHIYSPL
jgi:hypothetical protein